MSVACFPPNNTIKSHQVGGVRAVARPHALNVERNAWVNMSAVKEDKYTRERLTGSSAEAYAPVHAAKPVIISATIVSEALAALAMHAPAEHLVGQLSTPHTTTQLLTAQSVESGMSWPRAPDGVPQ